MGHEPGPGLNLQTPHLFSKSLCTEKKMKCEAQLKLVLIFRSLLDTTLTGLHQPQQLTAGDITDAMTSPTISDSTHFTLHLGSWLINNK